MHLDEEVSEKEGESLSKFSVGVNGKLVKRRLGRYGKFCEERVGVSVMGLFFSCSGITAAGVLRGYCVLHKSDHMCVLCCFLSVYIGKGKVGEEEEWHGISASEFP